MFVANWLSERKRRTHERVMQAVGAHQRTEDAAFEQKCINFRTYINDIQRTFDAFQLFTDSLDIMSGATVCMGDSIRRLHSGKNAILTPATGGVTTSASPKADGASNAPTAPLPHQIGMLVPPTSHLHRPNHATSKMEVIGDVFHAIGGDVTEGLRHAVRETMVEKCIKPTASILALVSPIEVKIAERKKILLDYDFYKDKLQRAHAALASSSQSSAGSGNNAPSENYDRIAGKLQDKMRELASIQIELEICFEEFEQSRLSMLAPEIAAYNACVYYYSSSLAVLHAPMFTLMPQSDNTLANLVAKVGITAVPPAVLYSGSSPYATDSSSAQATAAVHGESNRDAAPPTPSDNSNGGDGDGGKPPCMLSPVQLSYCKLKELVMPAAVVPTEPTVAQHLQLLRRGSNSVAAPVTVSETFSLFPQTLSMYAMDPILSRPPALGGSHGGYELLPSLFEQRSHRNSNNIISSIGRAGTGGRNRHSIAIKPIGSSGGVDGDRVVRKSSRGSMRMSKRGSRKSKTGGTAPTEVGTAPTDASPIEGAPASVDAEGGQQVAEASASNEVNAAVNAGAGGGEGAGGGSEGSGSGSDGAYSDDGSEYSDDEDLEYFQDECEDQDRDRDHDVEEAGGQRHAPELLESITVDIATSADSAAAGSAGSAPVC